MRCPVRWRRAAVRLVAACVVAVGAVPLRAQVTNTARFADEIQAFEAHDRQTPPPSHAVLFVGSSSIRMWCTLDRDFPELRVINRGFGGSDMRDVLHYARQIVLPYRPRTIVLYAGDNDLAEGQTPAAIHAAFQEFAALVYAQLPDARLVYLAVKPSVARVQLLPQMRATNALIREDARHDARLTYVDVFTPMLRSDGRPRPELFGPDGLHMNSTGYALWRAVLDPVLHRP